MHCETCDGELKNYALQAVFGKDAMNYLMNGFHFEDSKKHYFCPGVDDPQQSPCYNKVFSERREMAAYEIVDVDKIAADSGTSQSTQ